MFDNICGVRYIVAIFAVVGTGEFEAWYLSLDEKETDAIDFVVGLLEERGVTLTHPYSSQIKGSKYALRELRAQSGGDPLRAFYAFDPKRQAVLLIGGGKAGDDSFYARMIPRAEKIWEEYLGEIS